MLSFSNTFDQEAGAKLWMSKSMERENVAEVCTFLENCMAMATRVYTHAYSFYFTLAHLDFPSAVPRVVQDVWVLQIRDHKSRASGIR